MRLNNANYMPAPRSPSLQRERRVKATGQRARPPQVRVVSGVAVQRHVTCAPALLQVRQAGAERRERAEQLVRARREARPRALARKLRVGGGRSGGSGRCSAIGCTCMRGAAATRCSRMSISCPAAGRQHAQQWVAARNGAHRRARSHAADVIQRSARAQQLRRHCSDSCTAPLQQLLMLMLLMLLLLAVMRPSRLWRVNERKVRVRRVRHGAAARGLVVRAEGEGIQLRVARGAAGGQRLCVEAMRRDRAAARCNRCRA
jgi:hypothetical protein